MDFIRSYQPYDVLAWKHVSRIFELLKYIHYSPLNTTTSSQTCSTLFKAQYNMMMNRNYMPKPKLKTSYIKFKVNDDSYSIRLFPQLNENTYGRIDVIISKKPIEETTEGKLLKEMGVDGSV
ncbi:unnamed protein product [Rhizophagus irregularis]|nr:unnamed protein product [Rhizophagus irregularis]